MKTTEKAMSTKLSRRGFLGVSGVALGGLARGGAVAGTGTDTVESAHTPQGAFGYILSQMDPRPRLAVGVHFPVGDDVVECAYNSVRRHFPNGDPAGSYPQFGKDIIWPTDLMVVKVKKGQNGKPPKIDQFMGEVLDYTWGLFQNVYGPMADPKYPEPTSQLDTTNLIEPDDDTYCENRY